MREIILRFEKFTFFLTVLYIFVFFLASTEVFSYWTVKTLGDLQSTSRGLDPGVKM
jgi:hypothetical protein